MELLGKVLSVQWMLLQKDRILITALVGQPQKNCRLNRHPHSQNKATSSICTLCNGEPWFVAADVCRVLEIGNTAMAIDRLDEDEKMTLSSTDSHSGQRGGAQKLTIINEPGLYAMILGSRKPESKGVKRQETRFSTLKSYF